MRLSISVIPIVFLVFNCVNAATENAKPVKNPFLIWQVMPKLVEKLREKFPNNPNVEIFIPSLVKEIQQSIQVQSVDPSNLPALIEAIINQFMQQINAMQKSSTTPSDQESSTPSPDKPSEDQKPEDKHEFKVSVNDEAEPYLASELPDLAFDRDPDRLPPTDDFANPDSKLTDVEEEEEWEDEEDEDNQEPFGDHNGNDGGDHHHSHEEYNVQPILYPDEEVIGVNAKRIES